jgi:hypothetical protein
MKSPMLPADHHAAVQRALELGRSGRPEALGELVALLARPSNEVQRLAASAIGKLAPFGADPERAVAALAPLARAARHPQTQQYAIRALRAYGATAAEHVRDLRDVARNPGVRDYVREAAASAADAIEQAAADVAACVRHRCQRCNAGRSQQEHERAQAAFQRDYCDRCFDEVFLDTPQYKMSMFKKQTLYQQAGKRLLSVYPTDLPHLDARLTTKLRLFGFVPPAT